jgi:2-oxoglutarate ferredoxin oxidoreductase subunit beta
MMDKKDWLNNEVDIAWCPGCGDFGLRNIVAEAYADLGLKKEELCMVSGIGQAAKSPQYYNTSYFNGLHGRALPAAAAIKMVNPELKVVVQSGDGDMYGEGGNHFIHNIRRNADITVIVHNNMIYGLTKGQAAPTSQLGHKTPVQVDGVCEEPFNPLAVAISLGATFVAKSSVHEKELTKELIKQAIQHDGFALVDVFQACVSFNKVNTNQWFRDNTYVIGNDYDPTNRVKAFEKSLEREPWPLGLIYKSDSRKSYNKNLPMFDNDSTPLYRRKRDISVIRKIMESKK